MNWDWEKLKEQQRAQGGGPTPPQVDEIVTKLKNIKVPGGPIVIVVLLVLALASTMFYTVDKDEVGIVQRFGRFVRKTGPGLNFKLPAGIESITKVNVKRVETAEFGTTTAPSAKRSRFVTSSDNMNVSLMLTGDLNVAVVPWIIQYRINKPEDYLFMVNDVLRLLNDMSEATMRLVIGDRSINEVISKRKEIADEAKAILQTELNNDNAGIHIVTIEMKKTNVPPPVQPSFNEVNQATQEKEQMIYQANEDYNKAIPAARGEAERTIREAEGYSLDRINRAKGDASRFTALYAEYRVAKDITKRRLYLEHMGKLFPKIGKKYIVDESQNNLLPLLNLDNRNGLAQ